MIPIIYGELRKSFTQVYWILIAIELDTVIIPVLRIGKQSLRRLRKCPNVIPVVSFRARILTCSCLWALVLNHCPLLLEHYPWSKYRVTWENKHRIIVFLFSSKIQEEKLWSVTTMYSTPWDISETGNLLLLPTKIWTNWVNISDQIPRTKVLTVYQKPSSLYSELNWRQMKY